ncbi:MAG: hypothetical protein ACOC7X_00490 [Spirochaetota bacterium]
MKKAVVVSAAYVGFFLVSLTLLTAISLIFTWISNYSPIYQSAAFLQQALASMLQVLPAALALSLMLVLLVRTRSRTRAPVLSLVISILAIALYAGTAFLLMQFSAHGKGPQARSLPFYEQRLTQIEQTLLYTGTIRDIDEGYRITPLLQAELDKAGHPRISYYPQATAYPAENRIQTAETRALLEYSQAENPFYAFVKPPVIIHRLLGELEGVNAALKQSAARSWIFLLIAAAAHVLFLTGSWSLITSSSWPLLNALLALLVFRGFFFLEAAFRGGILSELLNVLALEDFIFLAAPAAFLLLAGLFILWGLVYNPAPKGAGNE